MKKIFTIFISIFMITGLLIGFNVLAEETIDLEDLEDEDVIADEDITAEDLEISEPKVLPDNPWYFVKNFWRGVRITFTFNKVKKVELRLRYANQRLIEAKKLAEKIDKEELVGKAVEKYQKEMEKIKVRVEKFKEKAADNPKIDKFLDNFTDKTMKQQRLMDRLEKNLSDKPEVLEKIRSNKERALEHFGEVMNKLEEKDKIPERLEKNMEKIEGSKYKNFKNLEVLMRLEEKVPEQAKEVIIQAQENALKRLHGNLESMSSEDQEKFGTYLEKVGGDQTVQLRILEKIKEEKPTSVLRQKIEQNRIQVQERVEILKKDRMPKEESGVETEEKIEICSMIWSPVCGKNGKTYGNVCLAKAAGVEIAYRGKCGTCAKAGERVNRNPLLGPADRKCCSGLEEIRVSKSYGICKWPEGPEPVSPEEPVPGIQCEVSITCEQGYSPFNTGEIDSQGCPIMKCVSSYEPVSPEEPVPSDEEPICQPMCDAVGTRSEGWYDSCTKQRIKWDNCKGCKAICKAIGTRSEGWYSSCTGGLIKYDNCEKEEPESSIEELFKE